MISSLVLSATVAVVLTGGLCKAATGGHLGFLPVAAVNNRSLHQQPVRSSAGLAIAAGVLAAWLVQMTTGGRADLWPVMLAAAVVAGMGWLDDSRGLPALPRLGIEIAVGLMILACFAGMETVWSLSGIALLLGILWFINLFNFMDGSDGMAASQTVTGVLPLAAAIGLGYVQGTAEIEATLAALTGACLAFLIFNRPPAQLFMGDAGSLFIPVVVTGFVAASPDPFKAGMVLLIGFACFVSDASLTLAIRIVTGERWWAAHRSHTYQLLARRAGSHAAPLASLWLYGVLWLAPVAVLAATGTISAAAALAAAYGPVTCGCAFIQWKYRRALAG